MIALKSFFVTLCLTALLLLYGFAALHIGWIVPATVGVLLFAIFWLGIHSAMVE